MQVNQKRNAFTLVELLVVLAVISVLAGVTLPMVKTALKNQRVTRGASLLQSAIQEGRARAILNGGGGIIIDRLGVNNIQERSQATIIRMAESPPPYTGDSGNATLRYQFLADGRTAGRIKNPNGPRGAKDDADQNENDPFRDYHYFLFDGKLQPQLLRSARDISIAPDAATLINKGDIIRISNARYPMRIEQIKEIVGTEIPWSFWRRDKAEPEPIGYGTGGGGYVMIEASPLEVNVDMRRHSGRDHLFSISKSPRPAIATPIEMGRGTAIDLTVSGIGRYGNEFSPMWIDGNYLNPSLPPFIGTARDYQSIYVLFGSRGEVTRVVTAGLVGSPLKLQLIDLPVTGDIHFLVGHAGQTKTAPREQLEDDDPNPFNDEAKDGKTPLLDGESVWVTIKARNGEVIASPLIDPTDASTNLIPLAATSPTNLTQQGRIRAVIGRTRTVAVDSQGEGL